MGKQKNTTTGGISSFSVPSETFDQIEGMLHTRQRGAVLSEAEKMEICDRVGPALREAVKPLTELFADRLVSKDYWGCLFITESVMALMLSCMNDVERHKTKDVTRLN